jgi:1,4-alpha-glucan branching enzyme
MPPEIADIQRLLAGEHSNPHSVLGAHPIDGGVCVRTLQPAATAVVVHPTSANGDGARGSVELARIDASGLFEGVVQAARLPLDYEIEAAYPDGASHRARDPYAYAPTLGELDLHLAAEGRHEQLYDALGARRVTVGGVSGVRFAVWAPNARGVSVIGDFNFWDGRMHPMRSLGASGIWELFLPDLTEGARYKFEIHAADGELRVKTDPFALQVEGMPGTAATVYSRQHEWADGDWLAERAGSAAYREPLSIYEVHLGSWRRTLESAELGAEELGEQLADYVADLGFTHVELLPVMAHPFTGSWGYQVTSYFAPDPRRGTPDQLRAFVERLHRAGIGVILDWVPAHFPRDDWALARFDGTPLYEHADPRRGSHPDWGTLVFNHGRREVRNFLLASALFWLREYHADGLRVDAVASMLYRDYSRRAGEWTPNEFGGREDLEAIAFLREMNELAYGRVPGVLTAAEESTAWPGVSRPTYLGGLGFGFKWNMGWMHDTLEYFAKDPIHRRYHHHELTFSLMYAFSESFILPLSHDEVVHGKGSLLAKMPGDRWQRFANLRALYAYMWAHPGKQLLFMGQEFAQEREWNYDRSLDWHLLEHADHAGVQQLVRDLNRCYRDQPALWRRDADSEGFAWLEANAADDNIVAFIRNGDHDEQLVCVCNLAPVVRDGYRVGLPAPGAWRELLNTDSRLYGGSNVGNGWGIEAAPTAWQGQSHSALLTLPPLGVIWLVPAGRTPIRAPAAA